MKRLSAALADRPIKDIVVTDQLVTAKCASGQTTDITATELERNFLGMPKSEKISFVAKAILKDCEAKDEAKAKTERLAQAIVAEAKRLKIDLSKLPDDENKKSMICEALIPELPPKDPERATAADWVLIQRAFERRGKEHCSPCRAVRV